MTVQKIGAAAFSFLTASNLDAVILPPAAPQGHVRQMDQTRPPPEAAQYGIPTLDGATFGARLKDLPVTPDGTKAESFVLQMDDNTKLKAAQIPIMRTQLKAVEKICLDRVTEGKHKDDLAAGFKAAQELLEKGEINPISKQYRENAKLIKEITENKNQYKSDDAKCKKVLETQAESLNGTAKRIVELAQKEK